MLYTLRMGRTFKTNNKLKILPKLTLTIIIPVFNEELALPKFINQLKPIVEELNNYVICKLLFVNNGSSDSSKEILQIELKDWVPAAILTLSRNFGYETALIAGLSNAHSDFYCFCDADGEDPVAIIPEFLKSMRDGYYIALGIRKRRFETFSTSFFRQFSYKILSKISDDPFIVNGGNFSMFNQSVKNAIMQENSSFPFLRATLSRCGYPLQEFIHDRNPRLDGRSKYRKINLLKFALAGFLTTTTWPLRLVAYVSMVNLPLIFILTLTNLFNKNLQIILLSELLLFFSIISLYLARIYKNSLGRPLFYVNWKESVTLNDYSWNL